MHASSPSHRIGKGMDRVVLLVGVFGAVCAGPLAGARDEAAVEAHVRVARAAPLDSYHIRHDDEGEAEVGYDRKKEGKGKKGYQKFDSFHKKGGDSYAFEKHDSFGHDDDKDAEGHDAHADHDAHDDHDDHGAYSDRVERSVKKAKKVQPHSEKYQEAPVDRVDSTSSSYEVKEGDEDTGDSGPPRYSSSSSGYDEADSHNYELPNAYEYGRGDDYNY